MNGPDPDRERFNTLYREIRDASSWKRQDIIDEVLKTEKSIPMETALIWAKIADLEDGIIRL